jgi:hypothetical protein
MSSRNFPVLKFCPSVVLSRGQAKEYSFNPGDTMQMNTSFSLRKRWSTHSGIGVNGYGGKAISLSDNFRRMNGWVSRPGCANDEISSRRQSYAEPAVLVAFSVGDGLLVGHSFDDQHRLIWFIRARAVQPFRAGTSWPQQDYALDPALAGVATGLLMARSCGCHCRKTQGQADAQEISRGNE